MIDDRAGLLRVVRPGRTRAIARKAADLRRPGKALVGVALLLVAVAPVTGCGATAPSVSSATATTGTDSSTSPAVADPTTGVTTPPIAVNGQHGRPAAGATTPSLPADWPPDVPLPHGTLTGATGANGLWTAQSLMLGSAAGVLQSTADFYRAAGFTAVSDSVLDKGNRQITLVVENRDHNAGETTLLIQVSTL